MLTGLVMEKFKLFDARDGIYLIIYILFMLQGLLAFMSSFILCVQ